MGIFRYRPLAAACILMILFLACAYALPTVAVLVCLCVIGALIVAVAVVAAVKHINYPRLLTLLLLLGALLGMGRVYLRQRVEEAPAKAYMDSVVTAEIRVEQICSSSVYGSDLLVRLETLNGDRSAVCAVLTVDGVSPYYIGDRLRGDFLCTPLEEIAYYEGQEKEYASQGAVMVLSAQNEIVLTEDGTHSIGAVLADLQNALHHRLTDAVEGEEGELLSALLFGTRDQLSAKTVRSFRRMGISHLLALSGLHLGMLGWMADRFLLLLRLGRRLRIPAVMLLCTGYLCLTGFSFSMLRAALMLSVLYLSFYAKGDYDGLTSLSLVGALILLVQPYAIFDLSFQMTVLATFGILALGGLQNGLSRIAHGAKGVGAFLARLLRHLSASLLLTLSATLVLLPIQWAIFGELSLMTPLANLILVPLCAPMLILGVLTTALSVSPAIGAIAGRVAALLPRLVLRVADRLADADCMLSLRWSFVPFVLLPAVALTVLLLAVRFKGSRRTVWVPMLLATLAFAVCLSVSVHRGRDELTAVYRSTGRNEGLILVQNGNTVICDLSNGSKTQLYADYRIAQSLCATEIDVLMLTHYHSRHTTSLSAFTAAVTVRELWLPLPTDDEDREIWEELRTVAAAREVSVRHYGYGEVLEIFNGGSLTLFAPLVEKRSVEPALLLNVRFGDESLSYMSAAYSEYARHALSPTAIPASDTLILGGHGPVPHETVAPVLDTVPSQILFASEDAAELLVLPDGAECLLSPPEKRLLLSVP